MISVIMATHRDDQYVWKTIDSVLSQQNVEFEFIIVANNCDENYFSRLKLLKDPRIRLHYTQIPQLCFNLNYALNLAQYEFIARIDSDDLMVPNRLSEQLEFFNHFPQTTVLGSQINYIDLQDKIIGTSHYPSSDSEIRSGLILKSTLCHPSVMFRKSVVLKHGGYLGGFQSEDYDLWLRLIENPEVIFANVDKPLTSYRKHANSAQGSIKAYSEVAGHFLKMFLIYYKLKYLVGAIVAVTKLVRKKINK